MIAPMKTHHQHIDLRAQRLDVLLEGAMISRVGKRLDARKIPRREILRHLMEMIVCPQWREPRHRRARLIAVWEDAGVREKANLEPFPLEDGRTPGVRQIFSS